MKPFIPEQVDWNLYFEPQHGGARFVGYPYQRGGNLFHFIRRIVPLFARSPLGKELISGAVGAIHDIRKGERPLKAIRTRGRQAIRNLTGLGLSTSRTAIKGTIGSRTANPYPKKRRIIRKKKPRTSQSLFVPALP